ncbi:alpha/beta fold hydrolase [Oxalobacteraceae bacterium]|nr:alpha/beta fold hydrolase [Oxalobacteraceae bacterium]
MRFSEDRLATLNCGGQVQRVVHVWEPAAPRAVIMALHGGMAHAGDYVTPALYFRERGIATVSYDMCGHENARRVDIPGFHVFLDEGELFLAWVKQNYPGLPIFLMGHSMGALIATHLVTDRFPSDPAIHGVILSSPYYVNAIKVSPLLLALAGVLGSIAPKMKVPLDSLTHQLTHDSAITARHYADERDGIRATEVTVRFGNALNKAQEGLAQKMPRWTYPLFAVVAGDDKLADAVAGEALLRMVDGKLLELQRQPQNYHENFNEVNREQIFADIFRWMGQRVPQALVASTAA